MVSKYSVSNYVIKRAKNMSADSQVSYSSPVHSPVVKLFVKMISVDSEYNKVQPSSSELLWRSHRARR